MKYLRILFMLIITGCSLMGAESQMEKNGIDDLARKRRPVAILGYIYPLRVTLQQVLISENIKYEKMTKWLAPKDYQKYSVVFIDGRLKSGFTKGVHDNMWKSPEDAKAVEDYLKSGGIIVLTSLSFFKLGNPIPPVVGFSSYEGLVGAEKPLAVNVVCKTSPVTSFLKKESYLIRPSVRVGKLTPTAKVLMEYEDFKGRKGPLVTENRIGKGALYWFSTTLGSLVANKENKAFNTDESGRILRNDYQKNTEVYRQMLVKAVLSGNPATYDVEKEVWASKPLGSDHKLKIAENGESNAVIVLANSGNYQERNSAQVLKLHLDAITGANIPIFDKKRISGFSLSASGVSTKNSQMKNKTFIVFGKHHKLNNIGVSLDSLGAEGVLIRTVGNTLVIAGKDDAGVRHSVYTFLELLGCRYLWPGELGKVIPRKKSLEIGYIDIFDSPRLWRRYIRQRRPDHPKDLALSCDFFGFDKEKVKKIFAARIATAQKDEGWFAWQRMGSHKKINAGHAFGDYWTRFGKEHLKWFALQPNGSRSQTMSSSRPRFCHSNNSLVKQIIKDKIAELRSHPNMTNISIALNDGGLTTFCMCEKCRKLDPKDGEKISLLDYYGHRHFPYVSLTDRILRFSNQIVDGVVKEFPEKKFVYYAYSAYSIAPIRTRPHHNLIIYVVDGTYQSEYWRMRMRENWSAWTKYGNDTFWRPNLLLANRRVIAAQNFSRKLFKDFRYCYNRKLCGTDFDTCAYNWALNGLIYYVLAKAHWNPNNMTYEQILNDYCVSGFGKASGAVKKYFLELEKISDRAAMKSRDVTPLYDVVTPGDFTELRKCLDDAKRQVATDPNEKYARRIEFLKIGLRFSELNIAAFNESRKNRGSQKAKIAREKLRKCAKTIMTRYPLAVNIPYIVYFVGQTLKD